MILPALAKRLSLRSVIRRRSVAFLPTTVAKVVPAKERVMASSTDAVAEKMAAMDVGQKKAGKKGGDSLKEVSVLLTLKTVKYLVPSLSDGPPT